MTDQDDHDGDEELEVVVREKGLDAGVDTRADCGLLGLSKGDLDARFELGEQVCELLVGVGLQVVCVS